MIVNLCFSNLLSAVVVKSISIVHNAYAGDRLRFNSLWDYFFYRQASNSNQSLCLAIFLIGIIEFDEHELIQGLSLSTASLVSAFSRLQCAGVQYCVLHPLHVGLAADLGRPPIVHRGHVLALRHPQVQEIAGKAHKKENVIVLKASLMHCHFDVLRFQLSPGQHGFPREPICAALHLRIHDVL